MITTNAIRASFLDYFKTNDHLVLPSSGLVPKDDPTVQRMLALREDIFDGYCVEAFTAALGATARIVREASIADSGRRLFWYDRS